MGLYMVKITLVFNFVAQGVRDENGKGVSSRVYKSSFVVGDPRGPEIGEPIVYIFLAVSVDELRCDTQN
jgi:hypothetical protein